MIRSEWNGESLTVYLDGEIDHCASEHWRQEIEAELKKRPVSKLVLDFSDVHFMDSSGVGMIIGRYKTVKALGGQVYAQGLNRQSSAVPSCGSASNHYNPIGRSRNV